MKKKKSRIELAREIINNLRRGMDRVRKTDSPRPGFTSAPSTPVQVTPYKRVSSF